MTSNNELRDRIAATVDRADTRASYDGLAVAMPKDVAQAIIDDLHLEAYDFTRHGGHTTTHVHGWVETQ